jgi:hypothetical protein
MYLELHLGEIIIYHLGYHLGVIPDWNWEIIIYHLGYHLEWNLGK